MKLDKAAKDSFKNILDVLLWGSIGALVVVGLFSSIFTFTPYKLVNVHGPSMEPTFSNGDLLILKQTDEIKRNQIAVFNLPEYWADSVASSTGQNLIKRVVAKPGDRLTFNGTKVLIESPEHEKYELVEPKIVKCDLPIGESIEVPPGTHFLAGDNRVQSFDSMEAWCSGLNPFIPDETLIINGDLSQRINWFNF